MVPQVSGCPGAGGTPRSTVQPLGTGALRHREAAQPDFVSPPGGGGSCTGRNFLERRHRSGRDVLWLWSRRSAVRRGTAAGLEAGRRCEREAGGAKRRGRYPKRDANGRSAPDKKHQAPGQAASGGPGPTRPETDRAGDCGRRTRHLPARGPRRRGPGSAEKCVLIWP
jgi:hypothetical protein